MIIIRFWDSSQSAIREGLLVCLTEDGTVCLIIMIIGIRDDEHGDENDVSFFDDNCHGDESNVDLDHYYHYYVKKFDVERVAKYFV